MKIMYCITRSNWGGAQAHVFELIKDQVNKGNEVLLVVGEKGDLFNRVAELNKVQLLYFPYLRRSLSPVVDFQAIFKLRRLIKKLSPDILHLHSSKAGAIGRIAAKGLSCKVIFTAHGWAFTEGVAPRKRLVYKYVERLLARWTDKIICVSEYDYNLALKESVLSINNHKGVVVYNGSKPSARSLIDNKKGKKIRLVMTARFDVPKRQDLLIKAIARLANPNYQVSLIGDGSNLENIQKMAEELQVSKQIKFLGFQTNVDKFLNNANIFVLLSDYEGLPISIIEAMSHSLPIVASDVGGVPEEVKSGVNGYLVQNSIDSVVAGIKKASQNMLELGNNSLNIFQESFSLDKSLENINRIYYSLL